MGFDPLLGVGKNPGRQPAVFHKREEISEGMPNTSSSTITIPEAVVTNFMDFNVQAIITSGVGDAVPQIVLFRNGSEIARLQYSDTYATLQAGLFTNVIYKRIQTRQDLISAGDTFQMQVTSAGGAGTTVNLIYEFSIFGRFVE